MDFDFTVTSERSRLDVFHNHNCGVDGNRDIRSRIADIHQKSKEITS